MLVYIIVKFWIGVCLIILTQIDPGNISKMFSWKILVHPASTKFSTSLLILLLEGGGI
jgi:hypothetical protein